MYIEEKKYKQIIQYSIIQTIDIICINHNKQILLGKRNNQPLQGVYYIPGGRRYKGETIPQSAKRKMEEELGLQIDAEKLLFLGVYDDIFNDSMYEDVGIHCSPITFVYPLSIEEEPQIRGDNQHSDFKFFDQDDNSLHDMVKLRIKDIQNLSL